MMQAGWPMAVAVPLTLPGLLCGLVNAALIHYTGISPLVITLGTLYLYGGGALLLSGMAGATGYEGIGGFLTASRRSLTSRCWVCRSHWSCSR
jgi:AI-2 transport system permease protein